MLRSLGCSKLGQYVLNELLYDWPFFATACVHVEFIINVTDVG
jgi:hypothetical protein